MEEIYKNIAILIKIAFAFDLKYKPELIFSVHYLSFSVILEKMRYFTQKLAITKT